MYPEIMSPGKSAKALRELLAIGVLPISEEARIAKAKECIANYRAKSEAFHGADSDIRARVQTDIVILQAAVDCEIAHRASCRMDDAATQFLEPITDYLYGYRCN